MFEDYIIKVVNQPENKDEKKNMEIILKEKRKQKQNVMNIVENQVVII